MAGTHHIYIKYTVIYLVPFIQNIAKTMEIVADPFFQGELKWVEVKISIVCLINRTVCLGAHWKTVLDRVIPVSNLGDWKSLKVEQRRQRSRLDKKGFAILVPDGWSRRSAHRVVVVTLPTPRKVCSKFRLNKLILVLIVVLVLAHLFSFRRLFLLRLTFSLFSLLLLLAEAREAAAAHHGHEERRGWGHGCGRCDLGDRKPDLVVERRSFPASVSGLVIFSLATCDQCCKNSFGPNRWRCK